MDDYIKIKEEEIAFLPNENDLEDNNMEVLQDYVSSGEIKNDIERKNEKIIKIMEKYPVGVFKNWKK